MKADIDIVKEVKLGDREAFGELVRRHQKALLRLSWRWTHNEVLAEDVVQESFIKAFTHINQFEEKSSFRSWIYRITINTAQNKLRSLRTGHVSMDQIAVSVGAQSERSLIEYEMKSAVWREVGKLPEKQRTALVLRVFEELSFKEIADVMDCPYDTAKANYRHALMKLKTVLVDSNWLKYLNQYLNQEKIYWVARTAEVEQ